MSAVMPIILYMTTLSLAEARSELSKLVVQAETTHERFEITKNGHRAAVLLGADDYDALVDTLEILADQELMADIKQGIQDLGAGRSYSLEQVKAELREAGRIL
jgi:prevent-host-death family protein